MACEEACQVRLGAAEAFSEICMAVWSRTNRTVRADPRCLRARASRPAGRSKPVKSPPPVTSPRPDSASRSSPATSSRRDWARRFATSSHRSPASSLRSPVRTGHRSRPHSWRCSRRRPGIAGRPPRPSSGSTDSGGGDAHRYRTSPPRCRRLFEPVDTAGLPRSRRRSIMARHSATSIITAPLIESAARTLVTSARRPSNGAPIARPPSVNA